jgi:hypothetical protein
MKRYEHDRRLGYTGDADGKNAFKPSLTATTQHPITGGGVTMPLGNGYYYALNPHEASPSADIIKELKAMTVKTAVPSAKEAK